MNFNIPTHVQIIASRIRQFVENEVVPLESLLDDESALIARLNDVRAKAKMAGLWCPQLPPELGGMGLTHSECVPVFESAGRSLLAPIAFNIAAPDEGNMNLLYQYADDEQRERYLIPLAAGEIRSAFAMTEPAPGAGSDPSMLLTSARPDGNDWIINGHKWFTSGADGAAFFLIMARTNPDVPAHQGATIFIAPANTAGIEIVRRVPIMGESGVGGHCEVKFNDLRLPSSAVLGEIGQGFALTQARLAPARLTHCMRWTGIAQRALEIATRYAVERDAFGKHLSEHQAIQWMLADSAIELQAGRLMIHQAAWLLDNGEQARHETSMCKVFVSETVNRVLDRAIQICGGMGISRDLPLSQWYEAARAFRIYDGASEVHRMVVARNVIKQFGRSSAN